MWYQIVLIVDLRPLQHAYALEIVPKIIEFCIKIFCWRTGTIVFEIRRHVVYTLGIKIVCCSIFTESIFWCSSQDQLE
jgi:hypothetical protein